MVDRKQKRRECKQQGAKFKKSVLAMCVMALSAPGMAQTQTDESIIVEEVIVTGMRSALQSAQDIKRDADTFVDSITASDIGALPDRSVLEAMQRLPGVSIERFQGPEDPDHFGVEGSGAVIRGMSATRSEFNGRDSFTANSGRGLSFQDVPPELMGGVDLYKNQSADMIEGGIGGTVSLRTRRPFDADGQVIAVSGDLSWGDMAKELSPTFSALYSDRWDTDAGEFGLLLNFAHSQLYGTSHGIQSDAPVLYQADTLAGTENLNRVPGDEDRMHLVWVPNGSNFFTKDDDRTRKGYAAAVQWESPDQTVLSTFQFMRSDARLAWKENAFKYQGGYDDRRAQPHPNPNPDLWAEDGFVFRDDGVFEAGYITDVGDGWRGGGSNRVRSGGYFGNKFQADTRYKDTRTVIDDFGLNIKWTPNDQWEVSGDVQYIQAETSDDDVQIALGVYALQIYDTRGDTPSLTVIEPWDGERDANPEAFANHPRIGDDSNYFQDPNSYWWRSAMDHYERSDGDSKALRLDATHYFEDAGLLRSVRSGVRFAEREQTVRLTSWNWGHIGAEWGPDGGAGAMWLADGDFDEDGNIPRSANARELANDYEYVNWSNFHRGGVANIPGDGFLFPTEQLLKDVIAGRELPQNNPGADGVWEPYPSRDNIVSDGIFIAPEVYTTTERNQAAYVRLDFGSYTTALPFSGNVGLRYVRLDRTAAGSVQFPDLTVQQPIPDGAPAVYSNRQEITAWAQQAVEAGEFEHIAAAIAYGSPEVRANKAAIQTWAEEAVLNEEFASVEAATEYARNNRNWLTEEERAFGNDAFELLDAKSSYSALLPSVNLRVDITDDLLARFAVSKAIAYPDMSEVRNQAVLGNRQLSAIRYIGDEAELPDDPDAVVDDGDDPTELAYVFPVDWQGSGGNPQLQPMESMQYDVSLEWYFAPVGSLTGSIFHKDLKNFFIDGAFPQTYTNPETGVTQTVDVTGTRNGGRGRIQGFEIAYQQFYDMLPAPWDGFGIQANYSYIDSQGVPNFSQSEGPTSDPDAPEPDIDTDAEASYAGLPLRGQSRHTFNLVGMYETDRFEARLAYNWRSRYLVTTRDAISKHPIWNDHAGFLDGSVFYDINDNINIGLQFTNLLNTQTKTIMLLDNEGREAGRTWFVNDRRAALVFRATY